MKNSNGFGSFPEFKSDIRSVGKATVDGEHVMFTVADAVSKKGDNYLKLTFYSFKEQDWTNFNWSGALFVNTRKEKESQADYTGMAKLDGVDYIISAWKRSGKSNGSNSNNFFFSLAFSLKENNKTAESNVSMNTDSPKPKHTNKQEVDDIGFLDFGQETSPF